MLKLFRNIRRKLIVENLPAGKADKIGSYVKYAIGEIVLVVFGILIAVQINSWNVENRNGVEEKFYLKKLASNIVQDTIRLTRNIENIDYSLKTIDTLVSEIKNKDLEQFSSQSLTLVMFSTFGFSAETSTFDNLISTGKLDLLKNTVIVDSIFVYYNQLENRTKIVNEAVESYARNTIGPYLMNFDKIDLNYSTNEFQFDIPRKTPFEYSQDVFIINAIEFKYGIMTLLKESYISDLKRAKNLIELIESEK